MDRKTQSGEGRLGFIVSAVLLIVVVMAGFKMIPVKIQSAQLTDYMVELAQLHANSSNDEKLEAAIMRRAKELDLPVDRKNIEVVKTRGRVRMKVEYTVPIEFPGYTYQWKFRHEVDRPMFAI